MKAHIRIEIGLGAGIIGRVDLIHAGGRPQSAVQLQARQVSQVAPLADDRIIPESRLLQKRVIHIEGEIVGLDQGLDTRGVVGHDRRGELLIGREGFQGQRPDHQVRLVAHGFDEDHQVFGQGYGGVSEVMDAHPTPVTGGEASRIKKAGKRLFRPEQYPPDRGIANQNDPVFVSRFRPGSDRVRGEHGVQIEETQVVRLGRILAKRKTQAAREQVVVSRNLAQPGRIRSGKEQVEHDK